MWWQAGRLLTPSSRAFRMRLASERANSIHMNVFGARSLTTSPVCSGSDREMPPVPGPAARQEEQEWMTSSNGSRKS